jgi:hypothetical protein
LLVPSADWKVISNGSEKEVSVDVSNNKAYSE